MKAGIVFVGYGSIPSTAMFLRPLLCLALLAPVLAVAQGSHILAGELGHIAVASAALPSTADIRKTFDAVDTSGNVAISSDEWDKATPALFKQLDRNNDGFLDRAELGDQQVTSSLYASTGLNPNAKLSLADFTELRRSVFGFADVDHDDNLSFVEYELLTLFERFGCDDRNHNGRIEPSELRAALTHAFQELDTDHDGVLSPEESGFLSNVRRTSINKLGDGKVTVDAFIGAYRQAFGS